MTTLAVALWAVGRTGAQAHTPLLKKPVWERTLLAARRQASRAVWIGASPPPDVTALSPRYVPRWRGPLLLLPANLALVTEASLRRLVAAGRRSDTAQRLAGTDAFYVPSPRALGDSTAADAEAVSRKLMPSLVYPEDEDEWLRVSDLETLARASSVLRRRKLDALLRRGVLVGDPATVHVDPEVSVGRGAELHPFVMLEGDTKIGGNCVVSSFCHVVDSVVGAGTLLLDHCFIRSSRIGKGASIGPFAHLRPDSDVGGSAKVGNFVELKKTRLGPGAKAPHLSYLGDATIGRNANIGAGTITCNYDGKRKHPTRVGDGAFIGSDVQLVAPVKVGKGAYVAAGSCIVEDVPDGALALARSRQTTKPGWARKRRRKKG